MSMATVVVVFDGCGHRLRRGADRTLTRVALAAYLAYTVSHLLFHAAHLTGMPPGGTASPLTGLSWLALITPALLILATGLRPPADAGRG